MLRPTKANLARSSGGVSFCSGDYSLNQNRRVYRYYWQVYTEDSPWEDAEFFQKARKLSIAAYMTLAEQLEREGKRALVYNSKQLRENHGLPLDMNHPRWKGAVLAPSLEDDTDPEYDGWRRSWIKARNSVV